MRRTSALAILPVAAVALLGSACGSDSKADDTTTTTTTTATSTSTTAGGSTSTTKAGTPACNTNQLAGELGPSNAGAGPGLQPAVVKNTSTTTCEVRGFPGVSLLDGSGNQIGEPATREGNEGAAVVLKPGESASATLHTTNEGVGTHLHRSGSAAQGVPAEPDPGPHLLRQLHGVRRVHGHHNGRRHQRRSLTNGAA